jgi:hypothetical protein
MIERFPANSPSNPSVPVFSMNLSTTESPPPYAGDTSSSTALVNSSWISGQPLPPTLTLINFPAGDNVLHQRIRVNDRIRFNFQGPTYFITIPHPDNTQVDNNGYILNPPSTVSWTLIPTGGSASGTSGVSATGMNVFYPTPAMLSNNGGANLPFQIFRQPIRSSVEPLQLPEGIVIDLAVSGMSTQVFDTSMNPVITFAPNGGIDMLYDGSFTGHPLGPIFLLLGKREQVLPPAGYAANSVWSSSSFPQHNLLDLNSFWITITPQTGQVSTSENTSNSGTSLTDLTNARALASGSISGSPVTTTGGR